MSKPHAVPELRRRRQRQDSQYSDTAECSNRPRGGTEGGNGLPRQYASQPPKRYRTGGGRREEESGCRSCAHSDQEKPGHQRYLEHKRYVYEDANRSGYRNAEDMIAKVRLDDFGIE